MDLKKVFIDKGQVSPELLAKVERARLKVELCGECRCLSERFSEVYRQLEKLELELGSTLRLIHGKLIGGDDAGKLQIADLNSNWNGLLEVLDVLRAEAIQKSSRELAGTPIVKLQNHSKKEIRLKQLKLEINKFKNYQESSQRAKSIKSGRGLESSGVRVKSSNDDWLSYNDNGNYLSDSDNVDSNLDDKLMDDDEKTRRVKIGSDVSATGHNLTLNEELDVADEQIVSKTSRSRNISETRKWITNPESGKRKCSLCPLEFDSYPLVSYHYNNVHLKLRYKCVSCNKLFASISNLRLHQRTSGSCSAMGSAPKHKCHLCAKSFALKHNLQGHLDGVHYKLQKYECDL